MDEVYATIRRVSEHRWVATVYDGFYGEWYYVYGQRRAAKKARKKLAKYKQKKQFEGEEWRIVE